MKPIKNREPVLYEFSLVNFNVSHNISHIDWGIEIECLLRHHSTVKSGTTIAMWELGLFMRH